MKHPPDAKTVLARAASLKVFCGACRSPMNPSAVLSFIMQPQWNSYSTNPYAIVEYTCSKRETCDGSGITELEIDIGDLPEAPPEMPKTAGIKSMATVIAEYPGAFPPIRNGEMIVIDAPLFVHPSIPTTASINWIYEAMENMLKGIPPPSIIDVDVSKVLDRNVAIVRLKLGGHAAEFEVDMGAHPKVCDAIDRYHARLRARLTMYSLDLK